MNDAVCNTIKSCEMVNEPLMNCELPDEPMVITSEASIPPIRLASKANDAVPSTEPVTDSAINEAEPRFKVLFDASSFNCKSPTLSTK